MSMSHREVGLQLLSVLASEIKKADKIRDADPYFRLRMLVRVLFSVIDALCFYLKGLALQDAQSAGVSLSKNEREVLEDSVRPKANKNITISFRCYARVRDVKYPLPSSGDVPKYVSDSIKIRNRLTHPKAAQDYDISHEELNVKSATRDWLLEMLKWATNAETKYIKNIQEKINSSIQKQIDQMKKGVKNSKTA